MTDPNTLVSGAATATAQLLQLLLEEQTRSWQQGQRTLVETYLERHPALRQQPQALLQLIAQEIVLRERAGETASLQEYRDRFPQLHDQLCDRLTTQASLKPEPRDATLLSDLVVPAHTGPRAPAPAPESWPAIPGYEIAGVLGRGGMGVVLHGRDPELRRDLAVKVLLAGHQDDPAVVQRFIEEAQIGGQLQHPGVVPVHALGRSPDGRPYFTMKLVKGRTLATLLHERTTPAQDLPRFLGIFLQVCQTLAYAHSKGVIHRDLKPANVMVGAFGEVQVMDWGLAKVLGDATSPGRLTPAARPGGIHTVRSDSSDPSGTSSSQTQAGSAMGTPSYMAPEQARGEVDRIDERCDVFGLGGILCAVLTGLPPYVADRPGQVFARAQAGDLAEALARLQASGAAPELVQLTRQCLAADPADRPPSAGAVAEAVTAYLDSVAERLRRAEQEWAAAQVKAQEERKRRKLTLALAAAVMGVVLVGGGSAFWLQRQAAEHQAEEAEHRAEAARQKARLRQEVEATLEKVAELRRQARWPEARAVLDQAGRRLGPAGPADLRRRLQQAQADVRLVGRLDDARLKLATPVEDQFDYAGAERDYERAFQQAGLEPEKGKPRVLAERIRHSAVRGQLVAALDDWAVVTRRPSRRRWLLALARRADPDPWRNRFRDVRVWQDRAALERLARQAPVEQLSPQLLTTLASVLRNAGGDALPLLRAAQARHPQDFWLNFELGMALRDAQQAGAAIGYYRAALALRPQASAVYNNLGAALYEKGELDQASACFEKVLAIDPKVAKAHNNLGNALKAQGRLDGAIACYQKALALDPRYARAHDNLGVALYAQGQLDGASACHQKALALDPRNAPAHFNLGVALAAQGRLDQAIACYRQALVLDPKFAMAHTNLGNALKARGQLDRAIACYEKALAFDPKLAQAHYNLGLALQGKGDLDGAIACYQKALAINPKHAKAHTNLGNAVQARGDLDGAIACYHKALAIDPRLVEAHGALGQALLRQGRLTEARDSTRCCLQLLPERHPLRSMGSQQLHQCERLLVLDARLPALLTGKAQPASAAEALEFAQLCRYKQLYAAAARFGAAAFAADPTRADQLAAGHRYHAACSAAQTAVGQGQDAPRDAAERARWRQQAVAWLRADLALLTRALATGPPQARAAVQRQLRHWQRDPALAAIRDAAWLINLPAEDLRACRQLWADVEMLRKRAVAKP
jgi:tetratricopeptide (TPR) repeat protein